MGRVSEDTHTPYDRYRLYAYKSISYLRLEPHFVRNQR